MTAVTTSFFAAVAGVFRGREIFPRLLRQRLWRAIFHAILMLLLCAAAGTAICRLDARNEIRRHTERFHQAFGEIAFGEDWLVPTTAPDKVHSLLYPGLLHVIYAPGTAMLPALTTPPQWTEPVLFWLPRQMLVFQPAADDQYLLTGIRHSGAITNYGTKPAAEIGAFLAGLPADEAPLPDPADPRAIRISAGDLLNGFIFAWLLLEQASSMLLFLVFFIGVFTLIGSPRSRTMTYRELLLTGIYVSLPVLPVACCFPVFDLPLLSFSTAYLTGAMGYFLFTVNFIEFSRRSGGPIPPTEG